MLKNEVKRVIDACMHYHDIIEERFTKDDVVSAEILKHYKYTISNTHYNDNDELNKAMLLDKSVYAYFNNNKFNEYITNNIKNIDKQSDLSDYLIKVYQEFNDNPETRITTTKWI